MKAIDIVKPTEVTKYDSALVSPPVGFGAKRIEVKQIEKLDPSICPPNSRGRSTCENQGEHSWFNHAMDKAY